MSFGCTTETSLLDLGSMTQYIKPTITNLEVKVDVDFKLDGRIRALVPSEATRQNKAFFCLRGILRQ